MSSFPNASPNRGPTLSDGQLVFNSFISGFLRVDKSKIILPEEFLSLGINEKFLLVSAFTQNRSLRLSIGHSAGKFC
jgi:hypothetical protein